VLGGSSVTLLLLHLPPFKSLQRGLLPSCRISKVHHILALQVGAGARVQRLWLRRQMTEEDKDELLHDPLACYALPFPRDSLRLADASECGCCAGLMLWLVEGAESYWLATRESVRRTQLQAA
jgi:hypothetical protein